MKKLYFLCFLTLISNANAHMYWVSPSEFLYNSSKISFEFSGSDNFPYPEVNRAFANEENYKISVFNKKQNIDFDSIWHGKTRAIFEATAKNDGMHVISLERTAPLYFAKTTKGWIKKSMSELSETEKEQLESSAGYYHSTKSYISIKDAEDDLWEKPVGHKLEIMPTQNPTKIIANSEATFKVIYNGKPLADNTVLVFYAGFSGLTHDDVYIKLRTDKNGMVAIKFADQARYLIKTNYDDKSFGDKNAQFYGYMATLMIETQKNDNDIMAQSFINICNEYKDIVSDSKKARYSDNSLLNPSEKNNTILSKFVNMLITQKTTSDINDILYKVDKAQCTNTLRNLSIISEEQMEKKAVNDFISYWNINALPVIKTSNKIDDLRVLFDIKSGYKFLYLDNYVNLISNELKLFKNDNLKDKNITFVGSGFPLSAVVLNIYTGAKINLVDINDEAINDANKFLFLLDKAGIIKIEDFTFNTIDGVKIDYRKIKTDIIYLASALPKNIKEMILKNISNQGLNISVLDRYVEDLAKLSYYQPLSTDNMYGFKEAARLYSSSACQNHKTDNNDMATFCGSDNNINSARLLML
jgi:uncharacterized GH25 family protein